LWISIVEKGWKWSIVPKPLYRYRVRRHSISEYGRAHRDDLLRKLVELHRPSYESNAAEILVEMDTEIRRQAETIRSLRQQIHEQEARFNELLFGVSASDPARDRTAPAAGAPAEEYTDLISCCEQLS